MAGERKSVSIHYRKFSRVPGVDHSLEELVRRAMDSHGDGGVPLKRRYQSRLFTQGDDNFFVNTFEDVTASGYTMVFGDILHFTKGHMQALCQTADPNAESVPVQQMRAPEQSEYVHSQMFWMLRGDHAFVIQSLSLKTWDLEKYLEWLLQSKTAVLPSGSSVILDAKFDEAQVGGDLSDIREIVIGGVVAPVSADEPAEPQFAERERTVAQAGAIDTARAAGWGQARNILRELLGGDGNVDTLMQTVPDDAELSVQVHIGFQTRRRNVDRVALKQLERGLRNVPDGQLQVNAKGIKRAADGSIRLQHNAQVLLIRAQHGEQQIIGSLLDPADVLRSMKEAYDLFANNGRIQV